MFITPRVVVQVDPEGPIFISGTGVMAAHHAVNVKEERFNSDVPDHFICSHRLSAQDSGFSHRRAGFDSQWEYQVLGQSVLTASSSPPKGEIGVQFLTGPPFDIITP